MTQQVIGDICAPCTEDVNTDLVQGTGDGFICGQDSVVRSLGNIMTAEYGYTPNVQEHRRGKDGAIDAILPLNEDHMMAVTLDAITSANLALALGQDIVQTVDGCKIALGRTGCSREYAFQFIHSFKCDPNKLLVINLWRCVILNEIKIPFGDQPASFTLNIRALPCESTHPDDPYGEMYITGACPAS